MTSTMTTPTAPPARAGRREWLGLAVLALPTLLLSLDVSVLYLAVPQLGRHLGADPTQQLWIMDIYSFVIAGFLVVMGTLGDRVGRRRLLLAGGAAFGVLSVVAAYSTSADMLIAARALLGVAGATLMPSTMALIRTMFPDRRQMGTALGIWFSCFMGGMTVGPLVGGVLLAHFWWGSVFLLGVPVMVLLLAVGPRLLPEHRDPSAGRLDLASAALALAAILPAVYGLKDIARDGVGASGMLTLLAGVAFGTAFVRRQRVLAGPMLDLTLFANRRFGVPVLVMVAAGVVMAGTSFMASQYLQQVLGLSPLVAGLWTVPQNVAMVISTNIAPVLARRFTAARVVPVGLLLAGAGVALLTRAAPAGGAAIIAAGMVVASFGIGLPMILLTEVVLGSVPAEKAGAAASIQETGGELGIALGVATLGSLGMAVHRSNLLDGVPAAFTAGLGAVAAVGGAIFLVLALAVAAIDRR